MNAERDRQRRPPEAASLPWPDVQPADRQASPAPCSGRPAAAEDPGPGCATVTIPTPSPTWRPRTPTPTPGSSRALATCVDAVFDEIKARTQETDLSVPSRKGPWWYSAAPSRASRTRSTAAAPPQPTATDVVLLDENAGRRGRGVLRPRGASTSAPAIGSWPGRPTSNGHEEFTLRIRDLDTGIDLPDILQRTYYGTAWSGDERHLFYTMPDDAMRPYQVWRHELGTAPADDVLVLRGARRAVLRRPRAHPERRATSSSPTRPTPRPTSWSSPPTTLSSHRS